MIKLLYIILLLGIIWYAFPYKEPFIGKYVYPSLNKNTRYFREKRKQLGENIGGKIKRVTRLFK
jgi:hypothetical protein